MQIAVDLRRHKTLLFSSVLVDNASLRRHFDRPALIETVTIRGLQGQTSRLSFVTLSIEQPIRPLGVITPLCNTLKRANIKTAHTGGGDGIFSVFVECSRVYTALNDGPYACGNIPARGMFCSANVGVCYDTVCTVQSERSRKAQTLFFTRPSSGSNRVP